VIGLNGKVWGAHQVGLKEWYAGFAGIRHAHLHGHHEGWKRCRWNTWHSRLRSWWACRTMNGPSTGSGWAT